MLRFRSSLFTLAVLMEVDHRGPAEFAAFIKDEMNRWSRVVKKANIKLEGKH